jgi:UDP-glucuronate decarboxylase
VDDLIEGLVALMSTPSDLTGPVNLGNPNEFTILELAQKVISITGSASNIEYKPLPEDDPVRRQPDISLAREHLKWEPMTQLEVGLKRTIEYFDKILAESAPVAYAKPGT